MNEEENVGDGETASAVRERAERERKQKDLNANNRGRMMPMDSAASAAMNITFRGAISGAFEGHLQSYVDLEKRQMLTVSNEGRETRRGDRRITKPEERKKCHPTILLLRPTIHRTYQQTTKMIRFSSVPVTCL